jgi:hypothetical protein
MSNPDLSNYVLDLKELDVLCGRGSGPNDRTGNIEFRNLILTRKAEYLAAKTREVKGRIASEVVNIVRQRGGRFLKKLSPAEAKDAGFKRGVNVYELADEPTVLEKAKQTLRQNRAAFEKQNRDDGHDEERLQGMNPDFDALQTQFNEQAASFNAAMSMGMPSPANSSGGSMNINPVPLNQASYLLDSDKLPQMGSIDARQLQNALFASSSISSKDLNSTNQMNLSMDLSALLGSMGSNNSGGSQMSNMSAEVFGSLIKDFNVQDQASLIQQYKALQDQQQQALMQQYAIMKQQHENMMQNMYPQFSSGNSNDMNMNAQHDMNIMNSNTHHFNVQNMNGQQNCSPQYQQNFPPRRTQQMFEFNNQSASGLNVNGQLNFPPPLQNRGLSSSSVETSVINNFSEDSLSHRHNTRNWDGLSSSSSSDVFHSLVRDYQPDNELQPQYENNQFQNFEMVKQTSNRSNEISQTSKESNTLSTISEFSQLSQDPVLADNLGSIARQQEFNDQQKLLQQFASLQSSGNEVGTSVSNEATSSPSHNAAQDLKEYGTMPNDDNRIVMPPPSSKSSPMPKRPSRKHKDDNVDQSLTLSFVTGKNLASKLYDEPMQSSRPSIRSSLKSSTTSSNKMDEAPRDSSLLSLMSMSVSLSEISHDHPSNNNPGDSNVSRSFDKNGTIQEGVKESSQEFDIHDMSMSSLGDGWTLDENRQAGGK